MTCKRCGIDTPRTTLGQRYCRTCEREVAIRTAPKPLVLRPTWMRRLTAKEMPL